MLHRRNGWDEIIVVPVVWSAALSSLSTAKTKVKNSSFCASMHVISRQSCRNETCLDPEYLGSWVGACSRLSALEPLELQAETTSSRGFWTPFTLSSLRIATDSIETAATTCEYLDAFMKHIEVDHQIAWLAVASQPISPLSSCYPALVRPSYIILLWLTTTATTTGVSTRSNSLIPVTSISY
ncbi:hypothetical protein F4776DRAFT_455810 [Hypoxylon sp. NC0597]|nr:hypothetical protein F4776DRAFT_455810 [Hypoxylon sp. NC0597]